MRTVTIININYGGRWFINDCSYEEKPAERSDFTMRSLPSWSSYSWLYLHGGARELSQHQPGNGIPQSFSSHQAWQNKKKYPARIVPTVLTVCLRRILILSVIPADASSIFPIIRILPYINSWTRTLTERLRSAALFFTAYAKNVRERSEQIATSGQTKAKKQSQK